jgi:1-acyl-sn-glycerol-3-phosphate acyltransferase
MCVEPPTSVTIWRAAVQYGVSRVVAGPFLHLLWRPEINGAANIPVSGGAIVASNHLSFVDSIFLPLMFPRPVTFVAKSDYFTGTKPMQRAAAAYLRATKQLSVDREVAGSAMAMLEAALNLLREGRLFGIYPEGTRSPDGRLYRGRSGIGYLAINSGLPVIPVAMSGTDRVMPPGQVVPSLAKIRVTVGEPLTFESYKGQPAGAKQRREVTDQVMKAIQALSGQEYVPMYASDRKRELAANNGAGKRGRKAR